MSTEWRSARTSQNIAYPYAEQIKAIESWAAANDRLGKNFLQAVLHDTPARLLALT